MLTFYLNTNYDQLSPEYKKLRIVSYNFCTNFTKIIKNN